MWDLCNDFPAIDRRQPRPEPRRVGALSDDDVALLTLIVSDLLQTVYPATLAMMAAGVVSGEVCRITGQDVSLEAGTVFAPGTSRVRPRILTIRREHEHLLRCRIEQIPTLFGERDRPLVYGGKGGAATQTSYAATVARDLFLKAGIDAQPKDLTAWVARNAANDGGLRAAAQVLGTDRIERVARVIGLTLSEGT